MSEPFLAEIRIVGFNFAPRGFALCDGQILPINQNQALFSLLGTTYGGDGRTSFALPDLRGRTPIHKGAADAENHTLGQKSGTETVVLTEAQIPEHSHELLGTSQSGASSSDPSGRLLGPAATGRAAVQPYAEASNLTPLKAESMDNTGGQGHENMQPFLALNFVIALQGVFPSRN